MTAAADGKSNRPEEVQIQTDLPEKPTRKNHYLYQTKIDMVKEILGAKTETEAIDRALDLLIYGEALARGTEAMDGEEYVDVLGIAGEIPDAGELSG